MIKQARGAFLEELFQACLTVSAKQSLVQQNSELMQSLLRFASSSPSNIDCSRIIEFHSGKNIEFEDKREFVGFKIKGKDIFVSQVVNRLEGIDLPSDIKEEFPELTQAEFDAMLRLVTLLLIAMEQDSAEYTD